MFPANDNTRRSERIHNEISELADLLESAVQTADMEDHTGRRHRVVTAIDRKPVETFLYRAVNVLPGAADHLAMLHARWEEAEKKADVLAAEVTRLKAAREWIPVSERLPPEREIVHLYVERFPARPPGQRGERTTAVNGCHVGGKWRAFGIDVDFVPTAWMPLPQPPEADRAE